MNKSFFFIFLAMFFTATMPVVAQKYACVNTDYVMKNIPDYIQAQKRINTYVAQWRTELEEKQTEIDLLHKSYQQEAYLLPDNLKQRRLEDLKLKEQELRDLQQRHFGPNGDLDKKREELLKPIQDRVYSTIEKVAHDKNYAFVFDKAASATVIYVNEKYDITSQVLEILGYKPGEAQNVNEPAAPSSGKNNAKTGKSTSLNKDTDKSRYSDFSTPESSRK